MHQFATTENRSGRLDEKQVFILYLFYLKNIYSLPLEEGWAFFHLSYTPL